MEVCLDCKSGNPSQLPFVPRLPLNERTTCAVMLTAGLKNEQGKLHTSVPPDVHRAVLNVPGGRLTQLLDEATASDFVTMRTILYSTLAAKRMPQGSPAFDTFVRSAQWILDPADPENYSWYVSNGAGIPADREALVQYITRDKVVPILHAHPHQCGQRTRWQFKAADRHGIQPH
uniref:Uncharacterized protein n=1 Tax=Vitiosangium cumulatum TaxID=1867796 RepID=A0A7D5BDH2_9BACT|nr:hypothetical protein [Vitiosangium cumulatum]